MAQDQDDDMYLFQGDMGQTPGSYAAQSFDTFLDASSAALNEDAMSTEYLNPIDSTVKQETTSPRDNPYTRASTSSASSSSSSDSPLHHNRNVSTATTASPAMSKTNTWDTGISGMSMPLNDQYYENNTDQDFDQTMNSAFDFDTAASTPSGYDAATMQSIKQFAAPPPQMRRTMNAMNVNSVRNVSPRITAAPASFFLGSREGSPMNTMLPISQAPSPWTKNSPSSGLEETFHHMGMNGDSPGNATFSPGMQMNYGDAQFHFAESTGTPSSFAKDISSPPSTIHSMDGSQPKLHVYPTSLKSRVETQIPIKMTMYPLPNGVKKLRLPTHTVSKPKFLAKPETDRSQDTFELGVSLVCTSAMQDPYRKERALARARGEDLSNYSRPSPASSNSSSSRDDEEKPLNGGEVRICSGCIQRERKRASRKKQKKPEEEELFQKDEERRVVVFNTNELKEWVEVTKDTPLPGEPQPPLGTMQVELPMRIACYCRHQNEKLGFQVIFTIKDWRDKVIAQAMTNSIMITDDHKTHNAPTTLSSQASQIPQSAHFDLPVAERTQGQLFKQSYSTPDLTRLQHNFGGQFQAPNNTPFAIPQGISTTTSGTLTPRNLSRPASPSGLSGPATKRRKPSGSGKLPTGLTMTRLDTMQSQSTGSATMPNTAASSPYIQNMPTFMAGLERPLQPAVHPRAYNNSPPTPGGDGTFASSINRSFSLENLPRQALMSAPSSRHPSRPGSPLSTQHNAYGQPDSAFPQAVSNQLLNQTARPRPLPVIHKLVPAEGSISGGTEVTLLGNGFYQGLEVMFGDTEATTTTFWGEKCLNCIAPPAVQPGMVAVVFKHEHQQFNATPATAHGRQSLFNYVDDRELELLRLTVKTVGKQMGIDDPYVAAQQILQQSQAGSNGMYGGQTAYGMANGHQRQISGGQAFAPGEMEAYLLKALQLASRYAGSASLQLDLRRPTGLTLLHFAASMNMPRFAAALISSGSDVNALDNTGFTPMHHAAMNGHELLIHDLRLLGADHRVRSIRGFVPADLATTLQAYQATMRPLTHTRSRSVNALDHHSRNASVQSLNSLWEDTSLNITESDSEGVDDKDSSRSIISPPRLPFVQPMPRSTEPSRRGSRHEMPTLEAVTLPVTDQPTSPSALMTAWRQFVNMTQAQQTQLAEQIQHFQDGMPTLPNLQLPEYQNTMMRRMSALFPQRQSSPPASDVKEQSPSLTAPPSYDELFPAATEHTDDKKDVATLRAAAEAAIDNHFERSEGSSSLAKQSVDVTMPPDIQRVGLMQDRRLFFFWVS